MNKITPLNATDFILCYCMPSLEAIKQLCAEVPLSKTGMISDTFSVYSVRKDWALLIKWFFIISCTYVLVVNTWASSSLQMTFWFISSVLWRCLWASRPQLTAVRAFAAWRIREEFDGELKYQLLRTWLPKEQIASIWNKQLGPSGRRRIVV